MRRFVGLCYVNFSPLKSMESQLSLEKKINVLRPKLIENERNEVLKIFHFFKKSWPRRSRGIFSLSIRYGAKGSGRTPMTKCQFNKFATGEILEMHKQI